MKGLFCWHLSVKEKCHQKIQNNCFEKCDFLFLSRQNLNFMLRTGSGRKETRSASTPHRDERGVNRRPTEIAPRSRRALLETAAANSNQMSQIR